MLQQVDSAIAFAVVMLMLSLLITVLVQVANSLLDMRGRSLAWGVGNLLQQIDPALRDRAARKWYQPIGPVLGRSIAQAVALHPAVAHGARRAKALRSDELIAILQDLASKRARVPLAGAAAEAVKKLVQGDDTGKMERAVGAWFGTVMDRASEIFAAQSRVTTFAFAAILAIALHIDSGAILTQISSSAEVRANLTRLADSAMADADRVLDRDRRASQVLQAMADAHKGDSAGAVLRKAPDSLTSCAEGRAWLSDYPGVKSLNAAALRGEFDQACDEQTRAALAGAGREVQAIRERLDQTELRLIPIEVGGIMVFHDPNGWWRAYGVRRHLLGTLATVLFLSLGAPFWYNALRQFSSLKPAIARRIDQEQEPAARRSTRPGGSRAGAAAEV